MGNEQVIRNIKAKKDLLANADPKADEFRIVLIAPGGGQRGVVQGAVGIGLKGTGMVEAFDYFVGSSAGATMCYYTLAGEPEKGTEIFYKENVDNHFVDFRRLWKIMDIDRLEQVFRVKKPISIDVLRASRPQFLVAVTAKKTGEGRLIDVKHHDDPTACVIASMCVPILSGKSVDIDGIAYVDGGIGNPLPITYAIQELGATDILVVMNKLPVQSKRIPDIFQSIIKLLKKRGALPVLYQRVADYDERYNRELAYIRGDRVLPQGARLAAIYPSRMPITEFTMDKNLLASGAHAATSYTERLFSSV